MEEIRVCPFCGGKAQTFSFGNDDLVQNTKHEYFVHIVCCMLCNSRTGYHNSRDKAINTWNKRIND